MGSHVGPRTVELRVGLGVVDVDGVPLEGGPCRSAAPPGAGGFRRRRPALGESVMGTDEKSSSPSKRKMAASSSSHSRTAFSASVSKTGWRSEGRPADNLEQLAGRRLLLERDPQLAVAGLQLLEQAEVLDGDDGLVGEGLEELGLAVGEEPRLRPGTKIAPIGLSVSEHRDTEPASPAPARAMSRRTRDRPRRREVDDRGRGSRDPESCRGWPHRVNPLARRRAPPACKLCCAARRTISPSNRLTAPEEPVAEPALRSARSYRRPAGRQSASSR